MSDISITGNEAQFNENVTFLKDVDINGELFLPDQKLSLNQLKVPAMAKQLLLYFGGS